MFTSHHACPWGGAVAAAGEIVDHLLGPCTARRCRRGQREYCPAPRGLEINFACAGSPTVGCAVEYAALSLHQNPGGTISVRRAREIIYSRQGLTRRGHRKE